MKRCVNILRLLLSTEQCIRAVILFLYAGVFLLLIISGNIYRYVHERHIPLLLISAGIFCILAALYCYDGIKSSKNHTVQLKAYTVKWKLYVIVFILPLTALFFSEVPLDFSVIAYSNPFSNEIYSGTAAALPHTGLELENDCIIVNDENFTAWLSELYTNLAAWEGKKITVSGIVWKDGELFAQNEFALARMMMICCAADMQPVGILAQWHEAAQLQEGAWVQLQGTLAKKTYQDADEPLIICSSVAIVPRPVREYVYP